MVDDKREDGFLICAHLYSQGSELCPKLPYMEATLSYTDDQGQSLSKYSRYVMFHIVMVSEMLLTGQCPLQYSSTSFNDTSDTVPCHCSGY
jgi:hypothetical protein